MSCAPVHLRCGEPKFPGEDCCFDVEFEGRESQLIFIDDENINLGHVPIDQSSNYYVGVSEQGRYAVRKTPWTQNKDNIQHTLAAMRGSNCVTTPKLWLQYTDKPVDKAAATTWALEVMHLCGGNLQPYAGKATAAEVYDFLKQVGSALAERHAHHVAVGKLTLTDILQEGQTLHLGRLTHAALVQEGEMLRLGDIRLASPELLRAKDGLVGSAALANDMWQLGLACLTLLGCNLPLQLPLNAQPEPKPTAFLVGLAQFEKLRQGEALLLTGTFAKDWQETWTRVDQLPKRLATLVHALLAADPEKRLTADKLLSELANDALLSDLAALPLSKQPNWSRCASHVTNQANRLRRDLAKLNPTTMELGVSAAAASPAAGDTMRYPWPAASAIVLGLVAGLAVTVGGMALTLYIVPETLKTYFFFGAIGLGATAGFILMGALYYRSTQNKETQESV